jgi:hypothetical protein
MSALRPLLPENDASYFPSAACGVTEPAKALPSVLVHLNNRWPLEGRKCVLF